MSHATKLPLFFLVIADVGVRFSRKWPTVVLYRLTFSLRFVCFSVIFVGKGSRSMNIHAAPVMAYRWITFLMAGGYCLYQLLTHDYANPGGPFRFLTIWALFLSFYSASRMLALSEQRVVRSHHRTAAVAAVVNVMVVFLYWRLFFEDPALVNGNGDIAWHQQYYLHGLGPALQIFDAVFIARAFGRPMRAVVPLVAFVVGYIVWAEMFVQRYNDTPVGTVTSGLPYPFLNSMGFSDRAMFYASNIGMALFVLIVLSALCWLVRKGSPAHEPESQTVPQ